MRPRQSKAARTLLVCCLLALGSCGFLWAQNENETVGFRPNHAFEGGMFGESIDVLNGGLNLTTPIGQRYRLNPRLDYGLTLNYNSKIWDATEYQNGPIAPHKQVAATHEGPFGIGFTGHFGRIFYAPERVQTAGDGSPNYDAQRNYTATWTWVSPDGSHHEFLFDSNTTYGGEDQVSAGPLFGRRKTNDLSYSLISGPANQYCPQGTPSGEVCFKVETAEGLVYTLEKRVECVLPGAFGDVNYVKTRMDNESYCGWYTTLIEDRSVGSRNVTTGLYPIHVRITYEDKVTMIGFEHAIKTVTDNDGRTISFHNCEWARAGHCSDVPTQTCLVDGECGVGTCVRDDGGNPNLADQCMPGSKDPNAWTALDRSGVAAYAVDVPGFAGNAAALVGAKVARYGFVYELARVEVANLDWESCSGQPECPNGRLMSEPVLKLLRVDYPDYTRQVGASQETQAYSLYYGYCAAYGAGCGGQAAADDKAEIVCRTLPLLRRVGGNDQIVGHACTSSHDMTRMRYTMDYYTYVSAYLSGSKGSGKECSAGPGVCSGGAGSATPTGQTRAVVAKTVEMPTGSPTPGGTWTYVRNTSLRTNPTEVVVHDPSGNDTVYQYLGSAKTTDANHPGTDPDDGLAPEWSDGLNSQVEYYEGTKASGQLLRSQIYEYDSDRTAGPTSQRLKGNTRKQRSITRYVDDGNREQVAASEDWDNYGHWRTESVSGFDVTVGRVTRRAYRSPYLTPLNEVADSLYIPGLLEVEEVHDGLRVLQRTDNIYDQVAQGAPADQRGRLTTSISRATPLGLGAPPNTTQYVGDIKTVYTFSKASGNVTETVVTAGPSDVGYKMRYTYGPGLETCAAVAPGFGEAVTACGGYLATKGFVNGGSVPWKAIDRDRDANTGLIFKTRDSAGVWMTYSYDVLGRITTAAPQGETATMIDYPNLQLTTVTRGTAGTSDYILGQYRYDGLGRVVSTGTLPYLDTLGLACQTTRYDAEGRTVFASDRYFDATCNPGTQYGTNEKGTKVSFKESDAATTSDPFGRARREIAADANSGTGEKVVSTEYFGNSSKVMVRDVAGTSGALFPAVTTFYRDGLGRLVYVDVSSSKRCSLSGRVCTTDSQCTNEGTCVQAGGGADAAYEYDAMDRLVRVDLGDGSTAPQTRRMEYDGLGRLLWADHPESGTTVFVGYDALGNLLEMRDAEGNTQKFVYDFAGRLTSQKIIAAGGAAEKVAVANTYDSDATPRGSSLGKLIVARSNDEDGSLLLTESNFYQGVGGRLSSVKHVFAGWSAGTTTGYTYDSFGNLIAIDYPSESPAAHTALAVDYIYSHGVVTKARERGLNRDLGVANYTATGAIDTLETPGGGRTKITYDDRKRPASIVAGIWNGSSWATKYYESGTYAYDGAGNIAARTATTGQESGTYAYDGSNRLIGATTVLGATSYTEAFNYDPFGNMTQRTLRTTPGTLETHTFTVSDGQSVTLNRIQNLESSFGEPPGTSTGLVGYVYDASGNLIHGGRRYINAGGTQVDDVKRYEYGVLNRVKRVHQYAEIGGQPYLSEIGRYGYDKGGNRIFKTDYESGLRTFFIRDPSGQVLSEFRRPSRETSSVTPEWSKDYVSLGGRTLGLKENLRPEPPMGLTATYNAGTESWTVSWQANTEPDVAMYQVYRKRSGEDSGFILLTDVSTPMCVDPDVFASGQAVEYKVTALDNAGYESAYSATIRIVNEDTAVPTAPTLTVTAGDRQLALSWTSGFDNAGIEGYRLERKVGAGGTWAALTSNLLTERTYVDLNLTNNQTYYYRVRGKDTGGLWSAYSVEKTGVPKDYQAPVPPRGLVACAAAELTTTVNLSWEASPDSDLVASYKVYRNIVPAFTGTPAPVLVSTVTGATSFAETGLAIGTYFYALKAVDGASPANESQWSSISTAVTRDPNTAPTLKVFATGHDGSVDVSWIPDGSTSTYRLYRRVDAVRSCYVLVGEASISSGAPATFTDSTVVNNQAYDYAVAGVFGGGVESAYSKPTLAIPLARPSGLFDCVADGTFHSSAESGDTVLQWTPPPARPYQPILATAADGTFGYLKGYHLYHHTVGGWAESNDLCTPDPCWSFIDNSRMRRLLVNQGDPIDPYLLTMTGLSGLPFSINDPRYALHYSGPADPAFVDPINENIYNSIAIGGGAAGGGENCVLPRAVYKIYAQGTWLTAESDWPSHFNNEDPDSRNRCSLPLYQIISAGPNTQYRGHAVPYCGSAANNPNYVAPPTGVQAVPNGPGSIRISWTPPSGVGAEDIAGYYLYMFRALGVYLTETVQRPLPFATLGADVTSFEVSGLYWKVVSGNYYFQVHSFDRSGRISYAADTGSNVQSFTGAEVVNPKPPRSVKNVLWTVNDAVHEPTRKGVKLGWQPATAAAGAARVGFRVYRTANPAVYGCALLAPGSQTIPLPANTTVCAISGPLSFNLTAGPSDDYFRDSTATQGVTWYYRVTQVEQDDGGAYHETDLAAADQIAAMPLRYDEGVLPPPQGFAAFAPQNGTTDRAGIYLQWCGVPPAATDDPMPPAQEYWIYRGRTEDKDYKKLAVIPRECLEPDGNGHARRCEITEDNACMTFQWEPKTCGTVTFTSTCGGDNQLPCAIVDLSLLSHWSLYPKTDVSPGIQAHSNFTYRVTAVGTSASSESMPSLSDEGWLNYYVEASGSWIERRDPEGIPSYKVCGEETVKLETPPFFVPSDLAPANVDTEATAEAGVTAPYRVIGQAGNPYSPPSRFLFYHLDHLGSPRVILDDTGAIVATHHYLPFGEERPTGVDPTLNTKAFTGHERDGETGLDYMLARYYSSSLARFMAVDPGNDTQLEDPQSWNRYSYTRNNPLRYTDPDGKALVDKKGQELHNDVATDPNRTPAEKQAVGGAAASPIKVETQTSNEAVIKVGAGGAPPSTQGLAPGEMEVKGDPAAVKAVAQGMQSQGQQVGAQDGTTAPGPVVGGQMQSAVITINVGTLTTFPVPGRTTDQAIRDTFTHEAGHVGTTGLRSEPDVRKLLKGTPSEGP